MIAAEVLLVAHAITPALRQLVLGGDGEPDPAGLRAAGRARGDGLGAGRVALTSPARSAVATAAALGLAARPDPELRDRDHGAWTGLRWADLAEAHPDQARRWLTDPAAAAPGGESVTALVDRVRRRLADAVAGEDLIGVTHPAVLRAALVVARDEPPAAYFRHDVRPLDRVRLRVSAGRVSHLLHDPE